MSRARRTGGGTYLVCCSRLTCWSTDGGFDGGGRRSDTAPHRRMAEQVRRGRSWQKESDGADSFARGMSE